MNILEISNLRKEFGDVTAVDDLSLSVEEGEIFGFLGPNGAGKSTTINAMLGFTQPTSGSVSVLDLDVHEDGRAIREHTGSLLEGYGVYERITPREHLERAIRTRDADDDPDELLERVGIGDHADRRAGDLSKGLRQRLALAMALVDSPELLVLDEPSTGLDPNGARRLREIIREENRRGATVFFSSHLIEQVEAVCDRVAIMQSGSVVAEGSVADLRSRLDAARVAVTVEWVPQSLVADLRAIDGVERVETSEQQILLDCVGGDAKVEALVRVRRSEAGFTDFRTSDPSLEELFSSVTLGDGKAGDGDGGNSSDAATPQVADVASGGDT